MKEVKTVGLIMASGRGSRLPLSTEEKPKQFLNLLDENETMFEMTFHRLITLAFPIYMVTLEKYRNLVFKSKPFYHDVFYEPKRMETGFSVLYGLSHIWKEYKHDVIVIQTPSDHFIGDQLEFENTIKKAVQKAIDNKIVLVGVKSTNPDESYGYIKNEKDKVCSFYEKPDKETAYEYWKQGYMWNSAIYVYRLSTMLLQFMKWKESVTNLFLHSAEDEDDHFFKCAYELLEPFKFEDEILMKVDSKYLRVVEASFEWEDIGQIERLKKVIHRGESDGRKKNKVDKGVDQRSNRFN